MKERMEQLREVKKTLQTAQKMIFRRVLSPILKMKMKTFTISVLVLVLVGIAAYLYFEKKALFIAATVNGSPVSRWSVLKALERQRGNEALEGLIDEKLLVDEIRKQNVSVEKADIDSEIKEVEKVLSSDGMTLDESLKKRGMTRSDLRERILMKKQLEQIFADKLEVSDEEVDQYIEENGLSLESATNSADLKNQTREQLQSMKLGAEVEELIADLRAKATIVHHIEY